MPNLRGSEVLILLLIVVLLFGAKRLPDAARSVGRSMRIFKSETKGLVESETVTDDPPAQVTASPSTPIVDDQSGSSTQDQKQRDQPPTEA